MSQYSRLYRDFPPGTPPGGRLLARLFPPDCVFCGASGAVVCPKCAAELQGLELLPGEPEQRLKSDYLVRAAAVWQYTGPARSALLNLKFHHSAYRAAELIRELAAVADASELPPADLIVPVPSGRPKGFGTPNSVPQLLAEGLAGHFHAPLADRLLYKKYAISPQHLLARNLRFGNPVGAFGVRKVLPADATVWLVDDVVTTGSTMRECARMLWLYGAKQVVALSFCAVPPYDADQQKKTGDNGKEKTYGTK